MGRALIITTGGGTDVEEGNPNATPQFVLSGYTFYANIDDPQIGTMPDYQEGGNPILSPDGEFLIPEGCYDNWVIGTVVLSGQTPATAEASEMSSGWVGWRDGTRQEGTMPWWGSGGGGTLEANGTFTVALGQHDGAGAVTQSLGVQGATNVTPGTSQKTVIAASKWTTGAQTVLGNGNLVAGNIRKNVTIFGVTGTYAGYTTGEPYWVIQNGVALTGGPTVAYGCTSGGGWAAPSYSHGGLLLATNFTSSGRTWYGWAWRFNAPNPHMYDPVTYLTAHADICWDAGNYGANDLGPGIQVYCEARFNMTSGTGYGTLNGSTFNKVIPCWYTWARGNYASPISFQIFPTPIPASGKQWYFGKCELSIKNFWFTYSNTN